jgi:hypothetical protein
VRPLLWSMDEICENIAPKDGFEPDAAAGAAAAAVEGAGAAVAATGAAAAAGFASPPSGKSAAAPPRGFQLRPVLKFSLTKAYCALRPSRRRFANAIQSGSDFSFDSLRTLFDQNSAESRPASIIPRGPASMNTHENAGTASATAFAWLISGAPALSSALIALATSEKMSDAFFFVCSSE